MRSHGDEVWRQSLTSGFVSWLILTPHPMRSGQGGMPRQCEETLFMPLLIKRTTSEI
jgi:hypothetical protein